MKHSAIGVEVKSAVAANEKATPAQGSLFFKGE
jgi:hypothetical protein